VLFQQPERLAAVGGLEHAVVRGLELLGDIGPEIVFVFNAKDYFLCGHRHRSLMQLAVPDRHLLSEGRR
jgi:hypothetical protein